MPAIDQIWFFLLAALVAGLGLGVFLSRFLSDRFAHVNEVRWKRRFSEMQAEHELSISKLSRTLRHSQEKQENLRKALDESDETVKLLSAERVPAYEQDVIERNKRIAELEKKVSHARARAADAEDHEAILQKEIDSLQAVLSQRDQHIDDLQTRNAELFDQQKLIDDQKRHFRDSKTEVENTLQKEIDNLQALLSQRDQRIDDLQARNAEFSGLQQLIDDQKQRYNGLQTEFDAARTELNDRDRQLAEMSQQLKKLTTAPDYQRELRERDSRLASLGAELDDLRQAMPTLENNLREREASIDNLLIELSQERAKTLSLEQKMAHTQSAENVSTGDRHTGAKVISIHRHLQSDDLVDHEPPGKTDDDTELRVHALELELQKWKRKYEASQQCQNRIVSALPVAQGKIAGRPDRAGRSRDDLKLIRGIGPVLETALNELGLYQFDQLAGLSHSDIEKMAHHDSSLPGRLRRYNWVEQARKLRAAQQPDRQRPRA